MKSFLLVLFGVVIGGAIGFFAFTGIGAGLGAGVGIVTGLKAGACLTVEAAKEKGFITAEQVAEVLQAASQQLSSVAKAEETDTSLTGGDAECMDVLEDLKRKMAEEEPK